MTKSIRLINEIKIAVLQAESRDQALVRIAEILLEADGVVMEYFDEERRALNAFIEEVSAEAG